MVAATFSKRIEGAAYVSRRAGTQVSSTSLMCDDQAEYSLYRSSVPFLCFGGQRRGLV